MLLLEIDEEGHLVNNPIPLDHYAENGYRCITLKQLLQDVKAINGITLACGSKKFTTVVIKRLKGALPEYDILPDKMKDYYGRYVAKGTKDSPIFISPNLLVTPVNDSIPPFITNDGKNNQRLKSLSKNVKLVVSEPVEYKTLYRLYCLEEHVSSKVFLSGDKEYYFDNHQIDKIIHALRLVMSFPAVIDIAITASLIVTGKQYNQIGRAHV